jgi:chorismate lyase/3-hydroxybenzoate synthase
MERDSARVRNPRLVPEIRPLACRLLAPAETPAWGDELVLATVCYGGIEAGAGPPTGIRVDVPLVPLGDPLVEVWTSAERAELLREGDLRLACTEELAFGALELDERDLEADVGRAYDLVLARLAASPWRHLLRMWNVIPRVGLRPAPSSSGALDRYMRFCRARSLAFERHHGAAFAERLGAASAVGSDGGPIVVYFLACRRPGARIGNPRQEEPWRYPERYGPRAPSFARGLRAPAPFERTLFVSGTASIVGHASRHPGDVRAQLEETLRNMTEVARSSGLPEHGRRWVLKTYLRDAADVEPVRARLCAAFGAETPVLFLRADVCRPELVLEIEGVSTSG